MKATIEDLQDTFKIGYEQFEESRIEAKEVWDMYHNRQYTQAQLETLRDRGQPAETFNVIKLFARMLLGYYSTVVNTVVVKPKDQASLYTSGVLNDVIDHVFRDNNFSSESDRIKLTGLIAGLLVSYVEVVPTGERDEFNRPLVRIKISHVPDKQVVLDPKSTLEDYSDAKWLHRFKWIDEDDVIATFGAEALSKLNEYQNELNFNDTEFTESYNGQFNGRYKVHIMYLIIHTVMRTDDGKTWSKWWSGDEILKEVETTHKDVRFPYRVQRVHTSDEPEYYGIFREVMESQRAVNQALLKLQLMANSEKAFVEETAVDDIDTFANAFNRVNGVIKVKSLAGIKIENLSREVLDQYTIIDKAFDRIQRILSINDSFLGNAFASDSGRKVKLQQNATVVALRYLTGRVEQFYRLLGWDIANLAKQYYFAHQFLRISDSSTGDRWVELNKPAEVPTGQVDANGQPITEYAYEEVLDPGSGEPLQDEQGRFIIAPIPEAESEIKFTNFDVSITSVAYNDEDEKNQLMLETTLSGNIGQLLAQVNPAGYFKAAALSVKTMQTKYSPDIANILEQTAEMLGGDPQAAQGASNAAAGQGNNPSSQMQKLPQNTNEA